ncbi:MAG: hypothetical protein Q7S37_02215 [bacterium]|nr:hypothetical protein [bacterium]
MRILVISANSGYWNARFAFILPGAFVVIVGNADEAISACGNAERLDKPFDVVILDISSSEQIEACDRICERVRLYSNPLIVHLDGGTGCGYYNHMIDFHTGNVGMPYLTFQDQDDVALAVRAYCCNQEVERALDDIFSQDVSSLMRAMKLDVTSPVDKLTELIVRNWAYLSPLIRARVSEHFIVLTEPVRVQPKPMHNVE